MEHEIVTDQNMSGSGKKMEGCRNEKVSVN